MATALSLALRITGDASGLNLTPVERALKQLETQTQSLTNVFKQFQGDSAAAGEAQQRFATDLAFLNSALKTGQISAEEFAKEYEALSQAIKAEADSFSEAARVIADNQTPIQEYEQKFRRLTELVRAGKIDQDVYNSAVEKARDAYSKATGGASQFDKVLESQKLKFNELSGIFSVLPGPLGNIAGRFSGIASAGEGLTRIFDGGLKTGLSSLAGSFSALANPLTASLAGFAAFGAAATAVANGLIQLEDRVEKLGNTADKLGVSFGFIQTLDEAARRSGTSIESVSAAFGRLQKSVLGVDEESKAAQKALAEIGVTSEDLAALSPEEQYQKIGQAIAGIEDPARRTATATALFGKAGADLIPFFNNIGQAAADIERYGRALTDLDRGNVDAFGASLDALGVATQGLGQSLLLPFVGLGDGIARALAEVTSGITAIVDPIGRILEPLLTQIGRIVELFGVQLGNLGRVIGAVFEPFAVVVQEVAQALEPLYEGFFNFLQGISNAGVAVAEWVVSFTPIGAIAANVGALGETISRVVTIITTAFSQAGGFVGDLVSRFVEFTGLSGAVEAIGNVIGSVFGSVSEVFSTIANAIGGVVGRLLTIAEDFLGIDRAAEQAGEGVKKVEEGIKRSAEETKALDKAFADSNKTLNEAINKSAEFGQAGFDAALKFQNSLKDLQELAADGDLNAEGYARGVALAEAEYQKQIESLKKIQEETKKATEEAQKRVEADRKTSEELLRQSQYGGDSQRAKAAENVATIEREILRIRQEAATGVGTNDAEERIRQLERVKEEQGRIADGSAKAAEEEKKRLEDQAKRVDSLIKQNDTTVKFQQQLADVQEQIKIAEAQQAQAREENNQAIADSAAARVAELDQLEAKLQEDIQAASQGFGDGFAKAFKGINDSFAAAQAKAEEFGAAGEEVFQIYRQSVEQLQEQARGGFLTAEQYDLEIERQQKLFENELKHIEDAQKKREDLAQKADQILISSLDKEAEARAKATEQLKTLAYERLEVEKEISEARAKSDEEAIKEATKRLEQLDAASARLKDVESGAAQLREQALKDQEKQQKELQSAQERAQQQYLQQQQKVFEERRKEEEKEFERQAERLRQLETLGSQVVNTADVRTTEGASLVAELAANAEDFDTIALAEQRKQTRLLLQMAQGLVANLNAIGRPAYLGVQI